MRKEVEKKVRVIYSWNDVVEFLTSKSQGVFDEEDELMVEVIPVKDSKVIEVDIELDDLEFVVSCVRQETEE